MLARLWTKGDPSALLVGMQTGAGTVENSMEFSQKAKNGTAFDPAIPLLGLYPKNPETPIQKNLCTPMFMVAFFYSYVYHIFPTVEELAFIIYAFS